MEKQTTLMDRLRSRLPLLITIFCLLQPLLDVAGYWQARLGLSNAPTMVLRMLLLGASVLLGFLLSRRKWIYWLTGALLAVLTGLHALACMQAPKGYQDAFTDLLNLVRIYFLPLMTLCFITFLDQSPKAFPAMCKAMVLDLLLIAGVQLASVLTGTNPYTYSVDKTGILGWFLWTNSQSAILAMLAPITICWAIRRWQGRLLPILLLTAVSEATLFTLAPRLAYGSLLAGGLGVAFCLLLSSRSNWKQALCVALVTCLFLAAYPVSPTYARLNRNEARMEKTDKEIKQMNIHIETVPVAPATTKAPQDSTESAASAEATAPAETQKPFNPTSPSASGAHKVKLDDTNADKMERLYRSQSIIWSMVDRFGREKVFEIYDYTLDPTILSNTRLMKINFCRLVMGDSGFLSGLFGLNLKELTHQRYDAKKQLVTDNYDVENDLHGIYFLTGLVGLVLMLLFLGSFGIRALTAVLRKPKVYFNLTMNGFAIAYGLALIHAYFTASVLRRNNASVYLAMVLAGLWYLSRKKTAPEPEKPANLEAAAIPERENN